MLYKRSSFLRWLTEKKECEIEVLLHSNSSALKIKNGPMSAYIKPDFKDRIDYEEVWLICNKLYVDGLPGASDLEQAD